MQLLSLLESMGIRLSNDGISVVEQFSNVFLSSTDEEFYNWVQHHCSLKHRDLLMDNILFFALKYEQIIPIVKKSGLCATFAAYYFSPKHVKEALLNNGVDPLQLQYLANGLKLEISDVMAVCDIDAVAMLGLLSNQAVTDVLSSYGLDKDILREILHSLLSKKKADLYSIQENINNIALSIFKEQKGKLNDAHWEQNIITAAVAIVFDHLVSQLSHNFNGKQRVKVEMALKSAVVRRQQNAWMHLVNHYSRLAASSGTKLSPVLASQNGGRGI